MKRRTDTIRGCLSVCMPACCLSLCLSVCLPVWLSVSLSYRVCLSACLPVCLSVYVSNVRPVRPFRPSRSHICLPVCSVWLSVRLLPGARFQVPSTRPSTQLELTCLKHIMKEAVTSWRQTDAGGSGGKHGEGARTLTSVALERQQATLR